MPFGINFSLKRAIGKTKTRSQMILMKTDDGRLVHREVPVLSACAVDEEICAGFLLDGENQYQDEVSKQWFQIVDEKSTIPLCLLHPVDLEDKQEVSKNGKAPAKSKMTALLQGIFHHSWTMDLATLDRETNKEKRNNMLYLSLVISVAICAIVIAFSVF